MSERWVENHRRDPDWVTQSVPAEVRDFHRALPGYQPTGLIDLPALAGELGVGNVLAKDESRRLGLPAFKALGASWAVHRVLRHHPDRGRLTFVTATDGNHGRAVARFAGHFGHDAEIFVPAGVHPAAVAAIEGEGATVTSVEGSYDDAVAAAAKHARVGGGRQRLLVQDTAWPGYEDVPAWIVEGYSTLFAEVDEQLDERGLTGPDLVVVPSGVGSLLQSAVAHYRANPGTRDTAIVPVEPVDAACVLESVRSGTRVTVETGHTVMAGLNCGSVSTLAWPHIRSGVDACVAVSDDESLTAAGHLASLGVDAGPCGAASLAALRAVHDATGEEVERRRASLGLTPKAAVVLLITEGADANPWLAAQNG